MRTRFVPALVLALAAAASPARATDQTVLGKSYVVKDPKPGADTALRSIVVLGKGGSGATIVGDPLTNGATLEIIANGATSSDQVFGLPPGAAAPGAPGWKATSTGFTYKDAAGQNGPVKNALVKKSGSGTFIVKVTLKGALGPGPQPHITVVPPAPGTDGGMRFAINGGDTYCVAFGGAAGGTVKNAPAKGTPNKVFKVTAPTTPGCPTRTSSTACAPTPPASPMVVVGALTATPGRFNYNLTLGLPGANAACGTNFPGSHACTYAELQTGAAACDLVGLKDTSHATVTSFWAIDSNQPALMQCVDDALGGSNQNWEYGTAHTASRGQRVALTNSNGALGPLQSSVQCNISGTSWVACCN